MQAAVVNAVARTVPDLRLVDMTKPQALRELTKLKNLCFLFGKESFSASDLRTMYKQNKHLQTTVIQRRGNPEQLFGVAVYGITSAPTLFASPKLVDRIVAFQIGNVVVVLDRRNRPVGTTRRHMCFCARAAHLRGRNRAGGARRTKAALR